jgi:hypothetical protein
MQIQDEKFNSKIPNEIDNEDKEPEHEKEQLLTTIKEIYPDTELKKTHKEIQDKNAPEYNICNKICNSSPVIAIFIGFSLVDIIIGAMNLGSCEIVSKYIISSGIINLILLCSATAKTCKGAELAIAGKLGFLIAEPIILFGNYHKEKEHCHPDYLTYAFWHFVVYYSLFGLLILGGIVSACIITKPNECNLNKKVPPIKKMDIELKSVVSSNKEYRSH